MDTENPDMDTDTGIDMKISIPQKREKIRLRRNKNALMGLFQKDAVPFLLYSMSLQVGDDSKNSSGTFCNFIREILQNH